MKVKTSSWHYKLASAAVYDDGPSKNLCTYFWQVAAPVLVLLFIGVFGTTALILLILEYGWALLWMIPLAIIVITTVAAGTVLTVIGYKELRGTEKPETPKKQKEQKEPNIFVEWLKAKKEKVCPIIEFE